MSRSARTAAQLASVALVLATGAAGGAIAAGLQPAEGSAQGVIAPAPELSVPAPQEVAPEPAPVVSSTPTRPAPAPQPAPHYVPPPHVSRSS